ncbi:hypothetical protein [Flocculibacter collagenilyticus]|uniref:hypothetical protein n=1 Tax=Flocculibacter collagenilyticus TaxID=2744479 RepID=UPI0018F677FC|nr:hypothetical protein [Flocculibacter collagenilyticus]
MMNVSTFPTLPENIVQQIDAINAQLLSALAEDAVEEVNDKIAEQKDLFHVLFETTEQDWLIENKPTLEALHEEFNIVFVKYLTRKNEIRQQLLKHKSNTKVVKEYQLFTA